MSKASAVPSAAPGSRVARLLQLDEACEVAHIGRGWDVTTREEAARTLAVISLPRARPHVGQRREESGVRARQRAYGDVGQRRGPTGLQAEGGERAAAPHEEGSVSHARRPALW
eukprot:scaffold62326_cov45-Phaeocystis_antarctica.AAC.1